MAEGLRCFNSSTEIRSVIAQARELGPCTKRTALEEDTKKILHE